MEPRRARWYPGNFDSTLNICSLKWILIAKQLITEIKLDAWIAPGAFPWFLHHAAVLGSFSKDAPSSLTYLYVQYVFYT